MATIDELMQGKKPGEIKVTHKEGIFSAGYFFIPYFRSNYIQFRSAATWYGLIDNSKPWDFPADLDLWKLYEEPKPEVKLVKYYRWYWRDRSRHPLHTTWNSRWTLRDGESPSENIGGEYYRDPTPVMLPE